MLPSRAYSNPLGLAPAGRPLHSSPDLRPTIVAAVGAADLKLFPTTPYTCLAAHTTSDAVRLIQNTRPRVVAVDLDMPGLDALEVCSVARHVAGTSVLVTTGSAERVPAVLKAGCHAVLLKPLTLNLVSARLGRLCREHPASEPHGTNRAWPNTACPTCGQLGAIGFEFSSHRRMWYACRGCEAVWLGPRQE